jgi:tRNA pseudouridine13 synthase
MKLKQQPSDFFVEEITNISVSMDKKAHSIFIMNKTEIDTFDAIHKISKKIKVPLFEIGYAGLKDKHAITKQYISIPTKYNVEKFNLNKLSLNFLGYRNTKIKTGDLKGNKFSITVRDIRHNTIDKINEKIKSISLFGIPNYFDSQRFGSTFKNEFIGKHLIKKNYEIAVKIFLTRYLKSENKNIKNEKRNIQRNWSKLENITVNNKIFANVIKEYLETKNWISAYKKIPKNLREMHINAYVSYLWNECIKEILRTCVNGKKIYSVKYAAGSLYFYKNLSEEELDKIPFEFPTLSEKVSLSKFENKIVTKVIYKENITIKDLDIKTMTGVYLKTRKRQVIIKPEKFTAYSITDDELNTFNRKPQRKITLSFSLPKGSYATVITKKIFNK